MSARHIATILLAALLVPAAAPADDGKVSIEKVPYKGWANNLRIAKGVPDDEKAKLEAQNKPLANRAKLASRTNFWLSIPMLLFMVAASHQWFFFS